MGGPEKSVLTDPLHSVSFDVKRSRCSLVPPKGTYHLSFSFLCCRWSVPYVIHLQFCSSCSHFLPTGGTEPAGFICPDEPDFRCFASALMCSFFFHLQGNGHHQVESHIRKKLDSLLKESRIGDKEDTDSFSIRALLRATHQGLQKNLRQVRPNGNVRGCVWSRVILLNSAEEGKKCIKLGHGISHEGRRKKIK